MHEDLQESEFETEEPSDTDTNDETGDPLIFVSDPPLNFDKDDPNPCLVPTDTEKKYFSDFQGFLNDIENDF